MLVRVGAIAEPRARVFYSHFDRWRGTWSMIVRFECSYSISAKSLVRQTISESRPILVTLNPQGVVGKKGSVILANWLLII